MELKDAFNTNITARKATDNSLDVYYSTSGAAVFMTYDFLARVMIANNGRNDGGLAVTPFSQLDRETLVAMREKLIELKGNPPELPAEAPANPGNTRALRP